MQHVSDAAFGQEVRSIRTQRLMSQRDLAEALTKAGLAVDSSAVSRIEKGTRDVRLSEAVTIAGVLGVDLDRLVGGMQPNEDRVRARLKAMRDAYNALDGAIQDFFAEQDRLQPMTSLLYVTDEQRDQMKRLLEYTPERAVMLARSRRESRTYGER